MDRKIRVMILTMVLTVLLFGGTRLMAQDLSNKPSETQTTPDEENLESNNEGEKGASLVEEGKNTDIDSNVANDDKETAKTKTETPEANKTENTENAPKAKQKEKKTQAKEAEKPAETPDVKAAEKTAVGNGPEDGAKLEAAPAKAPEAVGELKAGEGNGEDVDNGEPTKPVVEKDQINKESEDALSKKKAEIETEKDPNKKKALEAEYNKMYFEAIEKSGAEKLDDAILDRFTDKYRTKEYYTLKEEYEALKKKVEEGKITQKEIDAFNKKLGTFDPPRKLDDDEKSALEKLGKAPNFTRDLPSIPVNNTKDAKDIFENYKNAKAALEKVLDAENTDGKSADFNKLLDDFNKAKNALDNALSKGEIQPYYTDHDTTELRLYNIDGSGKMPEELKQGTYYIPDGTALDLLVQVNKDKTKEFTFTISAVGQKGVEISKEYLSNLAFLNGEPVELVNKGDGTYTFTTKAGTNFGVAQIRFNMPGFRAAFHKGFTVTMSSNEEGAKDVKKTFLITKKGYEDYADLSGIGTKDKEHPQENVDAGPTDNGIVKEDTKEAFDFYTLLKKSNAYIDKVLVNSANGDALPLSSVDITITIPDYNGKFAEYLYESGLKYHKNVDGTYTLKLDTKTFTSNSKFKVEDGKLFYDKKELTNENIKEALKNSILEGKDSKKYIDADGNEYDVVDKNILEGSDYKVQDNKLYKKEDGNYKELGSFKDNKLTVGKLTYELRGNTLLSYKDARTVYEGNVTNEGKGTDEKAAENVSETYKGKQVIVKDGDKESYGGTIVEDKIFKTEGDKEYYFNEQDKEENKDKYYTATTALISTEGKKQDLTYNPKDIVTDPNTGIQRIKINGETYLIYKDKDETRLVGEKETYKLVTNAVFNEEDYILDGLTYKSGLTLIDKLGRPIKDIKVTYDGTKKTYTFTKEGVKEAKTSGEGSNITISGDSKIYVDNKNKVVVPEAGKTYNSIKGKYYYNGKKFVEVEDKDVKDGKYYTGLTTTDLTKKLIEAYKKSEKEEVVIEKPVNRYFGGTDANKYYKVGEDIYYKVEDGQGTYLVKADATSNADIISANDIVKIVQTLGKGKELVTNETSIFDAVHNAKFKLMFPGFLAGKHEVYHIDAKVAAKYFEPQKDDQGNEILVEKSIFKDENKKETKFKEFSKYFTLKRSDKGNEFFFKDAPKELSDKLDYHFFNIFFRDEDHREERDSYVIGLLEKEAKGDYKDEKLKEVKDETEKKKLENERDFLNILKAELKKINPDAEFKYDESTNKLRAVYTKDGKEIEITRKLLWEIGFNNEAATIFPEDGDAEIVIEDHSMDNRLVYDEIIVNEEEAKWKDANEKYQNAKKALEAAKNDKTKTSKEIEALKEALKAVNFEGTDQYFYIDKIKDIRFGVNPNFVEGRFIPLGKDFVLTSKEIIEALKNTEKMKQINASDSSSGYYIYEKNEQDITKSKYYIQKGDTKFELTRDEVKGQIKIKVLDAFYKKADQNSKNKFYSPVQKAYEDKMKAVDEQLEKLDSSNVDTFKKTFDGLLKAVHTEDTECYGIINKKLNEIMEKVEKLKVNDDETNVKAELERIKKQLQEDIPKLKLQYLDTSKGTYKNDDMRFNAIRIALNPHLKIGGAMDETKTKKFGITSVIVPDIDIPYTDEFGKALTNKDIYVNAAIEEFLNADTDKKYKDYLNNEELFREVMEKAYKKVNDLINSQNKSEKITIKDLVTIKDGKFSLEKFTVKKGKDLEYKDLAINGKESIKDSNGTPINPWYIGEGTEAKKLSEKVPTNLQNTKEYKEAEESSIDLAAYYMSNKGYDRAMYFNNANYKLDKEVQSAGIFENKDDWKSKMCYSGIIGKCLEDAGNSKKEKPYGDDKNFGSVEKTKDGFELTYTPSKKKPDKENPKVDKKTEDNDKIDLSNEEGKKTVDFTISVTVDKKNLDQKKYELALDPKNTQKINESDYRNKFYIYKNALIMDILPDVFKLTAESSIEMSIDEKALKANYANANLNFTEFKNGIKYFYTDDVLKYLEELEKIDKERAEVLKKALDSKKVTGKQQAILAWLPEFEAPHGSTNQFTLKLKNVLADKKKFKDFDDGVIGTIYTNHASFNNKADIYSGSSTVTITDGHEGKVNKYLQVLDKDGNVLEDEVLKQWFKGSVELKFGDKFNYKIKYYQDKNLIKTQANPFAVDSEWNLDDTFAKVKDEKGHGLRPVLRDYLDVPEGFKVTYTVGDKTYSKEELEKAIVKGETSLAKVDKINIKGAYPDRTYQEFILPMMIPEFDAKVEDGKVSYIGTDGKEHELGKAEDFFDLGKLSKANEDMFATNTVEKSNTVTVYLDKERFIKLKKIFEDSEGKELKENLPEVEFKLHAYRIKLGKDGKPVKDANGNLIKEKVNLKDLGIEKDTLKLNKANNFFDAIYHLPLFKKTVKISEEKTTDDGTKAQIVVDGYMYEYELEEIPVKGYEFKGTKTYKLANGEDDPLGFVLEATNTEKPEYPGDHPHDNPKNVKVKITVNKVWKVLKGGETPSIQVELYANGKATGKIITLGADGSWSASFEDLPSKDKDGKDIVYTVVEVGETNHVTEIGERKFEVSYSIGEDGSITITNKEIPPEEPKDEKPKDKKEPKKHKPNDEEERDRTPKKNRIPKTGVNEDLGAIYFAFVLLLGLVFIKKRYLVK